MRKIVSDKRQLAAGRKSMRGRRKKFITFPGPEQLGASQNRGMERPKSKKGPDHGGFGWLTQVTHSGRVE